MCCICGRTTTKWMVAYLEAFVRMSNTVTLLEESGSPKFPTKNNVAAKAVDASDPPPSDFNP
jgi:hypothetical protein